LKTKPSLDFIYFEAGGGHKAAATALESVIAGAQVRVLKGEFPGMEPVERFDPEGAIPKGEWRPA
jgi:hypothetical protein